jgi:hypothetical protein
MAVYDSVISPTTSAGGSCLTFFFFPRLSGQARNGVDCRTLCALSVLPPQQVRSEITGPYCYTIERKYSESNAAMMLGCNCGGSLHGNCAFFATAMVDVSWRRDQQTRRVKRVDALERWGLVSDARIHTVRLDGSKIMNQVWIADDA